MITSSLAVSASENLQRTYFELGAAVSGSRMWREPGFRACESGFDHPIANFAADLDLESGTPERLARIALDKSFFNVYSMPGDRPDERSTALLRAGFSQAYELVQMVARPDEREPKFTLHRASTRYDRAQIAGFMVEQFFAKQPLSLRHKVADTTARATSLELLGLRRDGGYFAAAMVCFGEGMAGIYNVCVETGVRGLGIGSSMVREILAVCGSRGICATLQCDPKLAAWYGSLGFQRSGVVDVFSLHPGSAGLL